MEVKAFEANNSSELELILYILIIQNIKYTFLRPQLEIGDTHKTFSHQTHLPN